MLQLVPSFPANHSSSTQEPSPGTVLAERYRIIELLGEGSSGKVYAAEHVNLRKKLALKILHKELTHVPAQVARFEREALASAHLEHPNIAAALDFGKLEDGSLFLALEYVEGRTLRQEFARGPLSLARGLRIARQIASALVRAQELEIVHRDLKPENVMLIDKDEERDFVKVLDFGIARMPSMGGGLAGAQPITRVGAVFGTPEYMAPEQALGQPADGRADLYALGAILFEMIAGVRPYDARDSAGILAQQIAGPPPSLTQKAPGIEAPAPVEQLVQRLLQRELGARFQRASEVLEVLDTLLARASIHAPVLLPRSVPSPRLATFLPGDPLPAFELPKEGEPVPALPSPGVPGLQVASAPPDAPTLLRLSSSAPRVALPSDVAAAKPALSSALRARVLSAFQSACEAADAARRSLPAPWRKRLRGVPAGVLVASGAALASTLLIGSLAWLLSSPPAEPTPGSPPLASAAPKAAGSTAAPASESHQAPRSQAPVANVEDADSLLASAALRSSEGRDDEALRSLTRALSMHPNLRDDPRVPAVLFRAANSQQKQTADLAFGLMQGTMAARGAEVVYRLALDKSVRESVRKRAETWLRSPELAARATGALVSAVRLRYAETCAQKRELLPLAAQVGGRQTLDALRELDTESGCGVSGRDDCYPCLRTDGRLKETIARVEQRVQD